jgi:hypothetical protein
MALTRIERYQKFATEVLGIGVGQKFIIRGGANNPYYFEASGNIRSHNGHRPSQFDYESMLKYGIKTTHMPDLNEAYFYVDASGDIQTVLFNRTMLDLCNLEIGNVFEFEADAETARTSVLGDINTKRMAIGLPAIE